MRSKIQRIINLNQRVKCKMERSWLTAKIKIKWLTDKLYLPLNPKHYELYNIIHRHYWDQLHDFPNLINCRDFNDKIQWLKLFDQSPENVRCSDKILVRDYVRERVGEEYLVKLYQVHNHFSEIDFDSLPQSFVIKANHDSGTVILVRDKSQLDYQVAEDKIEASLQQLYGWEKGEWAYSYIQPKVFVEEFIEPENSSPPPDFKMQCVSGEMKFCRYTYDRGIDTKEIVLDKYANNFGLIIDENFRLGDRNDFKKPELWDKMIFIAETLGKGFKCVRVDLYCSGDRIYVGEMTFFPMAGCYKGEGQKKLGKYLDFDRTTFKPLLLPDLKTSC